MAAGQVGPWRPYGENDPLEMRTELLVPSKAHLRLSQIEPVPQPPEPCRLPALPSVANGYVRYARRLRIDGRIEEAAAALDEAMPSAPDHPVIAREIALTHWQLRNLSKAKEEALASLAVCDDNLVAHFVLGMVAAADGEASESICQLRLALLCSREPSDEPLAALCRYQLADALVAEDYFSAALSLYRRFHRTYAALTDSAAIDTAIREMLDNAATRVSGKIVRASERLQEYEVAAEYLRRTIEECPNDCDSRLLYARVLARLGDLPAAHREAKHCIAQSPGAVDLIASICIRMETPRKILDDLRAALIECPDDEVVALSLAQALIHYRMYREATELLDEMLLADPSNCDYHRLAVDARRLHGRFADAVDAAAQAIIANESCTETAETAVVSLAADFAAAERVLHQQDYPHVEDVSYAKAFLLGALAEALGSRQLAGAWYDTAIERKEDFIAARVRLARMHIGNHSWAAAVTVVSPEDLQLPDDTRLECLLGQACIGLDRLDEAVEHLQKAIKLNHANSEPMYTLAELYLGIGQTELAVRQLEILVRTDPLNEAAREQLFRSYLSAGMRRAASEQLAKLKSIAASPLCIARCAAWLEFNPALPDHETLRAKLESSMAQYQRDAETLHMVAVSFMAEKRYADAIRLFNEALAVDPNHRASAELIVGCYRRNLEFDKALAQQRILLERFPNRLTWKGGVIDSLLDLQQYDEAAKCLLVWLADPEASEQARGLFRSSLMQTYILARDYAAAIDLLEQWLTDDPQNGTLSLGLVEVLLKDKQYERAMGLIRGLADSGSPALLTGSTEHLWRQIPEKYRPELLRILLTVCEQYPGDMNGQVRLIELLRAMGEFDEALELARNNLAAGQRTDLFNEQMYLTYVAADRLEKAIDLTSQLLLEAGPLSQETAFIRGSLQGRLAELLIRSKEHRKALSKINRWLRQAVTTDQRVLYLRLLSFCQQDVGNVVEAKEALTLALELRPEDPGLSNDLGYMLADEGKDLQHARELIRTAVAGSPRNGAYLDSYGWLLYKQGEFAEAKKWLVLARNAEDGEDPVLCDHLADACWRLQQTDEALRWWRDALRIAEKRLAEGDERDLDQQTARSVQGKLEAAQNGERPDVAPTINE